MELSRDQESAYPCRWNNSKRKKKDRTIEIEWLTIGNDSGNQIIGKAKGINAIWDARGGHGCVWYESTRGVEAQVTGGHGCFYV